MVRSSSASDRQVKISISKENYLKAIAETQAEGEPVTTSNLARWLNLTAPAVSVALTRLKRDGLIQVDDGGQISLTDGGREIAGRILNRHQLVERMLTELLGMEWYMVHEEAEQLEHAVSADLEQKLLEARRGWCLPAWAAHSVREHGRTL